MSEGDLRIRVAFFIDSMSIGGTELNAVRTAARLDRERFDLSVFCHRPDGPLLERYRELEIPVHGMPIPNFYSPQTVRVARRVVGLLRTARPDVVHCHDRYSNVFGTTCARLAGVPAVLTSRRWWDDVPNPALRHANRLAYRVSDGVLANSATVGRFVVEHDGVAADRLAVVTNFVDDDAFDLPAPGARQAMLAELGVPADAPVVGIVANLRPVKDHATLLRAVARLGSTASSFTHVVLVGDGECRDALAALAGDLGIRDRVHFAGRRIGPPNLHHLFDVSVLCSLHEGFPNSVVEAMAAARPVVATAVGGVPDAVTEGRTGRLVPPQDPEALAAALAELLADADRRRVMGEQGRRRADQEFRAQAVLPRLEELYRRVAAGSRRRAEALR